jgi:quercetin dioxygenase-like cupin family protein
MKIVSRIFLSTVIGGTMMMSFVSNAAEGANVTSKTILKTSQSWDGSSYEAYPSGKPELSILKITVPPHTVLGWHTHPIPNAAYVLSGHLIVEKQSNGQKKTIHAGETLAETVGTIHRGYTDDEPVTLIVFYAGAEHTPLSEKMK